MPWGEEGADIICESTGIFTVVEKASAHLHGGDPDAVARHGHHADRAGHFLQRRPAARDTDAGHRRAPIPAGQLRVVDPVRSLVPLARV